MLQRRIFRPLQEPVVFELNALTSRTDYVKESTISDSHWQIIIKRFVPRRDTIEWNGQEFKTCAGAAREVNPVCKMEKVDHGLYRISKELPNERIMITHRYRHGGLAVKFAERRAKRSLSARLNS